MLRFGLIGCGAIARRHAGLLSSGDVSGARLSAVCDLDLTKAQAFAGRYDVAAFDGIDALMTSGLVDAVSVLTPSGQHASNVVALAPYGRPIVVEKPMALTLDDADRMIEACDRHGARLFVVKQNRFNRPVVALRRALDAGRFGKLVLGTVRLRWCRPQSYYDAAAWRGTWAQDGGVLANQASHHIDLLEWIMGDVESVTAMSARALSRTQARDTAVAILRFPNGALGIVQATTASRPKDLEGGLSILGEHGSVEVRGFASNELKTWNFALPAEGDDPAFEAFGRNPIIRTASTFGLLQHVVDVSPSVGSSSWIGSKAERASELIIAIYEPTSCARNVDVVQPERCRSAEAPRRVCDAGDPWMGEVAPSPRLGRA